jgi:RAQPRD family integrative conjugative element protein
MTRITLLSAALMLSCFVQPVLAQSDYEREQIRLLLVQLTNIETIAKQMESNTKALDTDRYRFDHARFHQDLKSVRAGLEHYRTPSRAQPRDVAELIGEYKKQKEVKHGDD